jgi:hypothetical protein
MRQVHLIGLAILLAASGCSDDDGQGNDNHDANVDPTDAGVHDAAVDPDGGTQTEFPIRRPASHDFTCTDGPATFWDTDHLCAVPIEDATVELYIQATPTACNPNGYSSTPIFADPAVYYRRGGEVFPTEGAYDWGSGHHNDAIKFFLDGVLYVIWHSSIGWGWRSCAPPDCLLQCNPGTTYETCDYLGGYSVDGCAREAGGPPPPLPVICVLVNADGSVPDLVDPWSGEDSLLPCGGDM